MKFELENMTPDNQRQVIADCHGDKAARMRRGGGHFKCQPGLMWAKDYGTGNYLMLAPSLDYMSMQLCYYFKFRGSLYLLLLDSPACRTIKVIDDTLDIASELNDFSNAIIDAFCVYGRFNGRGAPLSVVVQFS